MATFLGQGEGTIGRTLAKQVEAALDAEGVRAILVKDRPAGRPVFAFCVAAYELITPARARKLNKIIESILSADRSMAKRLRKR